MNAEAFPLIPFRSCRPVPSASAASVLAFKNGRSRAAIYVSILSVQRAYKTQSARRPFRFSHPLGEAAVRPCLCPCAAPCLPHTL